MLSCILCNNFILYWAILGHTNSTVISCTVIGVLQLNEQLARMDATSPHISPVNRGSTVPHRRVVSPCKRVTLVKGLLQHRDAVKRQHGTQREGFDATPCGCSKGAMLQSQIHVLDIFFSWEKVFGEKYASASGSHVRHSASHESQNQARTIWMDCLWQWWAC